jgi:hypothetical protein
MDGIIKDIIGLEVAEKLSDEYPELYPVLKDSSERAVINKAADLILEGIGWVIRLDVRLLERQIFKGSYTGY